MFKAFILFLWVTIWCFKKFGNDYIKYKFVFILIKISNRLQYVTRQTKCAYK
jgi:hypothetical protein